MNAIGTSVNKSRLESCLASVGMRPTRQRALVYEVMESCADHPTAELVFMRARSHMPTISLATVYNCLETLVDCGLVRAVHHDRHPARFCLNTFEHAHFHDRGGDVVFDVALTEEARKYIRSLVPPEYEVEKIELNFTGRKKSAAHEQGGLTGHVEEPLTFNQNEPGNTQP
jgi:Fur family peroxide stress response transcriptional regulator